MGPEGTQASLRKVPTREVSTSAGKCLGRRASSLGKGPPGLPASLPSILPSFFPLAWGLFRSCEGAGSAGLPSGTRRTGRSPPGSGPVTQGRWKSLDSRTARAAPRPRPSLEGVSALALDYLSQQSSHLRAAGEGPRLPFCSEIPGATFCPEELPRART